ncbi:hypothetical protein WA026_022782 [Henosepilachna vigintioctopunctata]|uniref:Uncharacterized protein n=1 Tax=Henosepilachna vigintioctopunctata TaxID=420089 RepID=A0AAW1VB64_9CUCU
MFHDNGKWFKTMSITDIPEDISSFLSLDPKFEVPCTKNDLKLNRLLANVGEVPGDSRNELRAKTDKGKNFICNRIFDQWRGATIAEEVHTPSAIVTADTSNGFKNNFDKTTQ